MYWITGAKGLLGSTLVSKCKAALHTGREVDIADAKAVLDYVKKYKVTHIINCAAFSLVDAAESAKEDAWRANAIGPEVLARVAKENGIKLIHISTDYVFPGDVKRPLTETDPVGPCNYYGESKLEGEKRALEFGACVIRTSWIFGGGGKNFVAKLFLMLKNETEIRLTDDQWGRPTYAPDLADAILEMLEAKGLYQYANSGVATKYEFAVAMKEEMEKLGIVVATKSIVAVPGKTFVSVCKRPVYSAFDTSKIEKIVKIRHWRESLKEFLCEQMQPC